MEKNAVQAKQWLDKCYPNSASSRYTNADVAERSGRLNSSVVPENILKKYVTMDKTWIHHCNPESNWQLAK